MKIRNQPDTPLQINDATNEQIPRLKWLTLNGNIVENIEDDIRNNIELWSNLIGKDRLKFIVSCDSQRHGSKVVYVTTIVFYVKVLAGKDIILKNLLVFLVINHMIKKNLNKKI